MPRRKASRTEASASSWETGPKTLPRGEAPNPTQLSFSPVLPSVRSSSFPSEEAIEIVEFLLGLRLKIGGWLGEGKGKEKEK